MQAIQNEMQIFEILLDIFEILEILLDIFEILEILLGSSGVFEILLDIVQIFEIFLPQNISKIFAILLLIFFKKFVCNSFFSHILKKKDDCDKTFLIENTYDNSIYM